MDGGYYKRNIRVYSLHWNSPKRAKESEGLMKQLLHHWGPSRKFWTILLLILVCSYPVSPSEDQIELKYNLFEEERPGTLIADIKKDSQISQRLRDTSVLESIRYQFLTNPGVNLAVDDVTGRLTVSGRVDRDSLCPSKPDCLIKLGIGIQPVQYMVIIKVTITLLDKNDNSPEFTQQEMTYSILESALPGYSIMLHVAKDLDSPKYGIKRYRMISLDDSDTFKLLKNQRPDGSFELQLQLNTHLNREERDRYHLRVMCYDGAPRPRTGAMDVYIEVGDTNDNPPVFQNVTYYAHMAENLPVGSSVVKVVAVDSDVGLNGEVEYSFSSYTRESYGADFQIHPVTGVIKIRRSLDHERESSYILAVSARDKGPNSVPAETTVRVEVIDMNDNAPNISVNLLQNSAHVEEHSPAGAFIAHISVTDRDSGDNGRINCSLSDFHFRLQELYSAQYKLVTAKSLDREIQAKYTLSLVCRDRGIRPQTTFREIPVTVTDINDNSPAFSRQTYLARIVENNPKGHYIVQVNATDKDTGNNSRIVYSLTKHVSSYLHIDSSSGVITASRSLDREQMQQVTFFVTASDHGSPRRTSTCTVILDIEDVNDSAPKFSDEVYNFLVKENMPPGTIVGRTEASDQDLAPGNKFQYDYVAINENDQDTFAMNPKNGTVTLLKKLDREQKEIYLLRGIVRDLQKSRLSSTVTINIHVEDVNDNYPVFIFPTLNNDTIRISNRVVVGHKFTRLQAEDKDSGNNGKTGIKFSIRAGNEKEYFILDSSTGLISVNKALDHISFQEFKLQVFAEDGGSPAKSALGMLHVEVDKSIPFSLQQPRSSILTSTNFTIVVSLTCACIGLSVILIAVIVFIRRKEKKKKIHKYNCRMEALKMLTAKDPGYSPQPQVDVQSPSSQDGQYSDCSDSLKKSIHMYEDNNLTLTTRGNNWPSGPEKQVKFALPNRYVSHPPPPSGRSLEKREVEVHHFLDSLGTEGERDKDSIHSGDGSNTDSGRGPSEEGEARHYVDINRLGGPRHVATQPIKSCLSHSSTLPLNMSQNQHNCSPHNNCNPSTTRDSGPVHLNYPPQGRLASFGTPQRVPRDSNNSPCDSVVETTYVPNNHSNGGGTLSKSQNVTETTFAPSTNPNAQNVTETTYVPQGTNTLQGNYQRPRKYLPINNNARDTTL